ncbi:hypothetical protein B0H63DRAFT_454239 [Podospora didyma]|uniref:Uncharacterized protein n=1 Tax=Podospora didyma TaxID=330526 RepID=A0AAE0N4K3_9PEZI|nr:hypothetical protein B0H63DRAFT_454239 [Podospora didyma]
MPWKMMKCLARGSLGGVVSSGPDDNSDGAPPKDTPETVEMIDMLFGDDRHYAEKYKASLAHGGKWWEEVVSLHRQAKLDTQELEKLRQRNVEQSSLIEALHRGKECRRRRSVKSRDDASGACDGVDDDAFVQVYRPGVVGACDDRDENLVLVETRVGDHDRDDDQLSSRGGEAHDPWDLSLLADEEYDNVWSPSWLSSSASDTEEEDNYDSDSVYSTRSSSGSPSNNKHDTDEAEHRPAHSPTTNSDHTTATTEPVRRRDSSRRRTEILSADLDLLRFTYPRMKTRFAELEACVRDIEQRNITEGNTVGKNPGSSMKDDGLRVNDTTLYEEEDIRPALFNGPPSSLSSWAPSPPSSYNRNASVDSPLVSEVPNQQRVSRKTS